MLRTVLTAVLLVGVSAQAQLLRNKLEKHQDRKALRQDKQEMREDLRDKSRLETLMADFDRARAANDTAGLARVEAEVGVWLKNELLENRVELARDVKEAGQGKAELRSDRRELRQDAALGRRAGVKIDDRHDKRDDRRDLRDDKRDAVVEAGQGARLRRIEGDLLALNGRFDPVSLDQKRALYAELLQVQRNEVGQNLQEKHEDKRELREDRRETREDRRDPLR